MAMVLLAALLACASPDRGTDTTRTAPAFDTLAALDPFLAYRQALALGEQQRFAASLPYFRRALAAPTDAWQPHGDYAISLFHAALEARTVRGVGRPVVRSSFERAAWMQESLRELDRAESLATAPEGRAFVIARRARQLAAWQLSWDAISEYERAAGTSRGERESARRAAALLEAIKDPARATAATTP